MHKSRGRSRKYESGIIRFIEDMPPGTEGGSDEEYEYEDTIKHKRVDVLLNRWNDVYVEGHSEPVDVVKVEIFDKTGLYEDTVSTIIIDSFGQEETGDYGSGGISKLSTSL